MVITTHLTVGAAVGLMTQNPALGFFAGILSHHMIDQVPHTDPGSFGVQVNNITKHKLALTFIVFDILLSIVLAIYLLSSYGWYWPIILGAFGGLLPDLVDNVPFWTPKLRKLSFFNAYHNIHETFHFTIEEKKYIWVGILTQIFLILVALILLV